MLQMSFIFIFLNSSSISVFLYSNTNPLLTEADDSRHFYRCKFCCW